MEKESIDCEIEYLSTFFCIVFSLTTMQSAKFNVFAFVTIYYSLVKFDSGNKSHKLLYNLFTQFLCHSKNQIFRFFLI